MSDKGNARRLPSVDMLAFAVGLAAMAGHYFYAPLLAVVALAVFGPSALREVGWLNDADEWTLGVARRAGFHAALVAVAFVVAGHVVPSLIHRLGTPTPGAMDAPGTLFGGETLRKMVIGTFLISYLLQYWGGRLGSFRVLLGVAALNLAPLGVFAVRSGDDRPAFMLAAAGMALAFVALAYLTRRWPRPGGGVLLALTIAVLAAMGATVKDGVAPWGALAVSVQALLVLGVTGIALVRSHD